MLMTKLFSFDGPVGRLISKIVDLFFLNLLWLVCCLPIVTIGASTAAMHYVTLRMVRDEESGIFRNFFHSFQQNLKQSVLLTLLYLTSGGLILTVLYLFNHMDLGGRRLWVVFPYIALLVHYLLFCYVFPVFARFDNTTRKLLRNSYLLAVRYPVNTLVVGVVNALPLLLAYFMPQVFGRVGFLWLVIMFAAQSYWNAGLFRRIFDQYED